MAVRVEATAVGQSVLGRQVIVKDGNRLVLLLIQSEFFARFTKHATFDTQSRIDSITASHVLSATKFCFLLTVNECDARSEQLQWTALQPAATAGSVQFGSPAAAGHGATAAVRRRCDPQPTSSQSGASTLTEFHILIEQ